MTTEHRRIGVVGSGVAGLTAAYVASRTASVTLFEADDRLGGHADTHVVDAPEGTLHIDTGFIVHNRRTYPTLLRLFAELDIATQASEMSLSVSDRGTGVEFAGALGARGLFPTKAAVTSPAHWRMLAEIPRFHRRARAVLASGGSAGLSGDGASYDVATDQTLREFLTAGGFSEHFVHHFMEPMVAAVWSCAPETSLDYPARYLFTFLEHHGMLGVFGSPQWRTVTGGSGTYVAAVAAHIQSVRTGTKVTSVREVAHGVEITDSNGGLHTFDAVVIAVHPEQALTMLESPTTDQREVLSALPYSANTALLHTDISLLPRAANARSSWNFQRPAEATGQVTVTYDLTRLQRLPTETHYLVTLGGEDLVDPATVIDRMEYEHPLYTPASVAAQQRLPSISSDRVAFAGAYHGWGFHEDGARSGLAAAHRLGLTWPAAGSAAARVEPGLFRTTITHTRRTPIKRTFEHRSHLWLVDLDDLPSGTTLASFEARDHLGSPDASIRANVEAFLAASGVDLDGGRILMAANPRSLGYSFNPISVFWCFDSAGAQAAVVVEVHNTYGDRHAYLVHPDGQGRARTDKAMYVSPFHGVDGHYEIAVPIPTDRIDVAVTLHTADGQPFSARVSGERVESPGVWRSAGAALRGSALIRAHGIWLWARRLQVHSRGPHHQEGVR
ncbi:FAD-dependent oxidoreductase [Nocardioides sp.]|uniref:FAD-dependent oxidoreductase n=1 Tax=Nocardioides sp. TaxID=35761 RepID=UPI002C61F853|nr:DUF1365 family protein [Nocardioides sp.]HXH79083.1 DUF1365 family protein [Nocardioides sp.]